jgi:protein phosphatase-4 regulatory subunit 3
LAQKIVPLENRAIVSKVHQTFRIQYIKDVILPRALDESTFSFLHAIIQINFIEILQHLLEDSKFMKDIFNVLRESDQSESRRKEVVSFFQEFCGHSKYLQGSDRAHFHKYVQDQPFRRFFSLF